MPITATVSASSLSASRTPHVRGPSPQKIVTAAPFTPKAQKQAQAINTSRSPHRGHVVDIKA